jgi:acetyl-CoA carboxylase biotin carboxyl carrier protein
LTEVPEGLIAVRSPMVGSFYLRPSPDQPPFVAVGSRVQADDTVCLVEVMKMFNTVKAGVAGTVERIVIDNGKPVQHDQIVMLIKPIPGA